MLLVGEWFAGPWLPNPTMSSTFMESEDSSSLRCWLETDEQFHVSESKGPLHGRRRRGARTISSSRCSSSAQGGRFSSCSTRFLGSAEVGSGLVPSSHSFVRV